jgi:hypothetical protein
LNSALAWLIGGSKIEWYMGLNSLHHYLYKYGGWCRISYEIDDYTIFGGTKVQHIWGDFFFQCLWDWRKSSCLRLLFEVYIPVFGQSWIDLYRLNEIEHRVLLFNHMPCSEVLTANHLSSNWSIRFCPDCLSIFQGAASLSTKMNSQLLSTTIHILWQYIWEASIGVSLVRDWLIFAQQTDPSLFCSKVGRVEAAGSLKVFHLSPPIWNQTL